MCSSCNDTLKHYRDTYIPDSKYLSDENMKEVAIWMILDELKAIRIGLEK